MKTIDEVWAFCAIDPADGTEGLISMQTAEGHLPFVCADRERVEQMWPLARRIAQQTGRRVLLKRFATMTVEGTIDP